MRYLLFSTKVRNVRTKRVRFQIKSKARPYNSIIVRRVAHLCKYLEKNAIARFILHFITVDYPTFSGVRLYTALGDNGMLTIVNKRFFATAVSGKQKSTEIKIFSSIKARLLM